MFKTLLHKYLRVPYRLYVRYDSKKGNETIVLLHGLATSGEAWKAVYDDLSTRHRVIVLDLLGFGASPKPDFLQYTVDDHERAVARTLRWLGVYRYYIVGHSMGAIIALHHTVNTPRSVKGLLCASMPAYDVRGGHTNTLVRYRTNAYISLYTKIINSPDQTLLAVQTLGRRFKSKMSMSLDKTNMLSFQRSLMNTIIHQNTLDDLRAVAVRTHVVFGRFDALIIQNDYSEQAIPNPLVTFKKVKGSHILDVHLSQELVVAVDELIAR